MTISIDNIRIFPTVSSNGIVAYASAIINGGMYIGSIAIHEKKIVQGIDGPTQLESLTETI